MDILLIRHGLTQGNLEKRYVSNTDEHLLNEEVLRLKAVAMKLTDNSDYLSLLDGLNHVYVSSRVRTQETAKLLFAGLSLRVVEELDECDFGEFEYMNYRELSGNRDYQLYIDSNGEASFPGGESKAAFTSRIMSALNRIVSNDSSDIICIVAHGGTLRAILSELVVPHKDYFDWEIDNGCGYLLHSEGENNYTVSGLYPGHFTG